MNPAIIIGIIAICICMCCVSVIFGGFFYISSSGDCKEDKDCKNGTCKDKKCVCTNNYVGKLCDKCSAKSTCDECKMCNTISGLCENSSENSLCSTGKCVSGKCNKPEGSLSGSNSTDKDKTTTPPAQPSISGKISSLVPKDPYTLKTEKGVANYLDYQLDQSYLLSKKNPNGIDGVVIGGDIGYNDFGICANGATEVSAYCIDPQICGGVSVKTRKCSDFPYRVRAPIPFKGCTATQGTCSADGWYAIPFSDGTYSWFPDGIEKGIHMGKYDSNKKL